MFTCLNWHLNWFIVKNWNVNIHINTLLNLTKYSLKLLHNCIHEINFLWNCDICASTCREEKQRKMLRKLLCPNTTLFSQINSFSIIFYYLELFCIPPEPFGEKILSWHRAKLITFVANKFRFLACSWQS